MSDETNVEAGSEVSGAPAADTTVPAQADTSVPATDTPAPEAAPAEQPASADAGDAPAAAEEVPAADTNVPVDGARTGFVEKGQAGGTCICPDGRKGTIHTFDAGLVCIPNHDQSE